MQDYELDAWLGDTELTVEQQDRLEREAAWIDQEYPDVDDLQQRTVSLTAVVQYLLGETTVADVGVALGRARLAALDALTAAKQTARLAALDGTCSESEAASLAGLDRMTLRRLLGKR